MKLEFGGHSKERLLQRLSDRKIAFNAYAVKLFMSEGFSVSLTKEAADLEIITPAMMGFKSGSTFSRLAEVALERGLAYCSLEMAAYLRLQCSEAAGDESYLTVATKPPTDSTTPNGFYLRSYDSNTWLRGYMASSDVVFDGSKKFVFVVSNAQQSL